jgi:hypothetical protein
MKHGEVAWQRLRNQHIATAALQTPAEVVAWLGAVQAQDYPGGLWAVGLRTRNATHQDVERALADRAILRTWPMRGTLHFVAASDAQWMLDLLAARVIGVAGPRERQLELDERVFSRSRKLVVKALEGGRQLTRTALYAMLDGARISTAGGRGLHIVFRLALEGLICFAARDGKQQTFALLAEWAPAAKKLPRDESLAELARRYFTSHGPATWRDFAWWSGLRTADAREAIHLAATLLVRETIDGQEVWRGRSMPRAKPQALSAAYLLPPFDEYTVAYKDRTAALDPKHAKYAQFGGMLSATIVVNGQVSGTWKRSSVGGGVTIMPTFFGRALAEHARTALAASERYGRFLELPVKVAGQASPPRS